MTKFQYGVLAVVMYGIVMVAVIAGLLSGRHWALAAFSDQAAQTQWDSFRDDVARQTQDGTPVRRRVPASVEPPALVLMRDYFAVCATIAIVLTSALFATTAYFVGGVAIPTPKAEMSVNRKH